jgi:hypothetical protein
MLVGLVSKAQLPYLNASTGNAGEFPVDKDTNLYMFHGNRLVKTDKNFNIIWANTYGNLQFKNLLLSKTGSMFFIADKTVGKIENNGAITWCLDLASNQLSACNSILLDHNNDLVITGQGNSNGFFAKVDTNGVPIKFVKFNGPITTNIHLNYDSVGYYQFVATGINIQGFNDGIGTCIFNDALNNFYGNGKIINSPPNVAWNKWNLIRSRFNNSFYVYLREINYNNYYLYTGLLKSDKYGNFQWRKELNNYNGLTGSNVVSHGANECENGDMLFQMETCCTYTGALSSGVFRINSNGSILAGYQVYANTTTTNYVISSHSPQNIYASKCYLDLVAPTYTNNPLTVGKFDFNSQNFCNLTATCNSTLINTNVSSQLTGSVIVSQFSVQPLTVSVTPVNFSINANPCTITHFNELVDNKELTIYPNPASTALKFSLANSAAIEEVHVLDVNGKNIKTQYNCKEISVSDLSPGVYFIQLKSDGQTYYSKFIKE